MSQKNDIQAVREKINQIDEQILSLLAERRAQSDAAVQIKDQSGLPLRDGKREEELLVDRIQKGRSVGLDSHFVTKIYHQILEDSNRVQRRYLQDHANTGAGQTTCRVAFQGIEGAYSHLAAQEYFAGRAPDVSYVGHQTYRDTIHAVEKGEADYAMLPIENTTSGGNNEVYDLLLHAQVSIVGEEKFKVSHCLVGLEGAALGKIKTIYCHPQTVMQCSDFLATLQDVRIVYQNDSALSGKMIKEEGDHTRAAIASEEAARLFGLSVLNASIANQRDNFTRFLVAARKPARVDERIPCKTSIVMSTAQEPGSLVDALGVFRESGINLTKLESRPMPGNAWEEMFYVDFEGNLENERVKYVLDELTRRARFIKVLGCYPAPICKTSAFSATAATSSGDSTSVTTGIP